MPYESRNFAARDRVLLYTRGMDIAPEEGVALALESLRRAGPEAGPAAVMEEMFVLLRERGKSPIIPGNEEAPLACAPPINRRTVLPRDIEPLSLTSAIAVWCRTLVGARAQKAQKAHKPHED